MADFRIALGGTISACTEDELKGHLGSLKGELLEANRHPKPIYRPLANYANYGNMNQFDAHILELGTPASGRIWRVTRVTVLGNGDTATLTNVFGALYIGDPQNAALPQCVQNGTQIPFTTIENESAFIVHDRETLFLNVIAQGGASSGVTVTANAIVWEYPESAFDAQAI